MDIGDIGHQKKTVKKDIFLAAQMVRSIQQKKNLNFMSDSLEI